MQIVIEIPKGFYEHVKAHKDIFTYGLVNGEKIGDIIAKGIILPEKHRRLIILSEDAVKREYTSLGSSCQSWISDVGLSNATVAIIEPYKAESEDKK